MTEYVLPEQVRTCSPLKEPACDKRPFPVESRDQRRERRRGDEGVKPIHQAAVPRNEVARVLNPEAPLQRGFEQIAEFGNDRRRKPEPEQPVDPVAPPRQEEAERRASERAHDRSRPSLAR